MMETDAIRHFPIKVMEHTDSHCLSMAEEQTCMIFKPPHEWSKDFKMNEQIQCRKDKNTIKKQQQSDK